MTKKFFWCAKGIQLLTEIFSCLRSDQGAVAWLSPANQEMAGIGAYLMPTTVVLADNCHPPNKGKTYFLYFLFFRLLGEQKTVEFQVEDFVILFQDTGLHIFDSTSAIATTNTPQGTWALTDFHQGYIHPCQPFLDASLARRAWVVQTTSHSQNSWQRWQKVRTEMVYWMDVASIEELIALG